MSHAYVHVSHNAYVHVSRNAYVRVSRNPSSIKANAHEHQPATQCTPCTPWPDEVGSGAFVMFVI